MTSGSRRGVTRGYVGGLITAAIIVAAALVVAAWGLLSLGLSRDPVTSDAPFWAAPLVLSAALAVLAWSLWREAILLLRGRRGPSWAIIVAVSVGAYLLWCLGGLAVGFAIGETWTSPFAAVLAPIWAVVSLLFWAVLARRVYTDRPVPQWPWENRDHPEGDG